MSDWLRPLLLAIGLLLGQVGAHVHALGHLAEPHHEHPGEQAPICGECLAFGHFGTAAPAVPLAWTAGPPPIPPTFTDRPNPHLCKPCLYFGRAPPVFSA